MSFLEPAKNVGKVSQAGKLSLKTEKKKKEDGGAAQVKTIPKKSRSNKIKVTLKGKKG